MKNFRKILGLILIIVMTMSVLTACMPTGMVNVDDLENNNGNADSKESDTTENTDENNDAATDNEVEDTEREVTPEDIEKVAKYVESIRDEYEESTSSDLVFATISARETSVVEEFKFTEEISDKTVSALETGMNSTPFFRSIGEELNTLQAEEPAISSIIVEYYDMYGNVLVSKEFK